MMRRILGLLVAATLTVGFLAQAADPPAKGKGDAKPAADAKPTTDIQREAQLKQQVLAERFRAFEAQLLQVAQRMAASSKQEDREKAAILMSAIKEANESGVDVRFNKLVDILKGSKAASIQDVKDAIDQADLLTRNLRAILAILMTDSRDKQLADEKDRIQNLLKELNQVIRDQKINRAETERGNRDAEQLARDQARVNEATKELAGKMGGKDGSTPPKNGEARGEAKSGKNAGESKEDTKSKGEGKGGEGKEGKEGKGGEGKEGKEGKGGEGKEGKPGEGKEGKGGEGKEGAGEGKEGKGGEGKEGAGEGKEGKGGEGKEGAGEGKEGKGGEGKEGKAGEGKGKEGKGGEGKGGDPKAGEGKGGDPKAGDGKGGEGKGGDPKAGGDGKGGEGKGGEGKAGDPKAGGGKGGEGKSKAQGKGEGKGGEGKAGEGKGGAGEAKGKGGEGKGGEGKGGEGKGGEGKGGEGKGGEGKSGQPGEAKGGGSGGQPKAQQPQAPPTPGKNQIEDALPFQKEAKAQIENKNNPNAVPQQDKALDKLEEARKRLEEILKQLREEEIERLLAQLQARCEYMLQMQKAVYEATVRLDKTIGEHADKKATRPDEQRSQQLADQEGVIAGEAEKAKGLLESEGTAVAFTEVFKQLIDDMKLVQKHLVKTEVGLFTQKVELDIIQTLEEMIEALKKAQQEMKDQKSQPSNAPPPPPGQQQQKLIDILAELKMIRSMQIRVNGRTTDYGKQFPGEQADKPDVQKELKNLADRQDKIRKIVSDIASGRNQ